MTTTDRPVVVASGTVGTVVPVERKPAMDVLRAMRALVDDAAARSPLIGAARDERVAAAQWDGVLVREFAHTLTWLVRRVRAPDPAVDSPGWPAGRRVVVLLPRHGHLVHVVRRALPFALSAVPTTIAGHPHQTRLIGQVVRDLRTSIGLPEDVLRASEAAAADVVAELAATDLVVVTGATGTAAAVRAATSATVLAACGRCTLGAGTDRAALARLAAAMEGHSWPGSCTNWHGYASGRWDRSSWTDQNGAEVDPRALLARMRPTALYTPVADLDARREAPARWHGYTVLPCAAGGVVADLAGFARDPVGGWPGDFTA